jgi:hypothetical protein
MVTRKTVSKITALLRQVTMQLIRPRLPKLVCLLLQQETAVALNSHDECAVFCIVDKFEREIVLAALFVNSSLMNDKHTHRDFGVDQRALPWLRQQPGIIWRES